MTTKPLGFMQLTIICGFSLFYAFYLIAFFGFFMFADPSGNFVELHAGQVVFFGTSALATCVFLAQFRKADSVAFGHVRFLRLAVPLLGSALPACVVASELGAPTPLPLFYAANACAGASIGIGFMLWEDLSTHGYLKRGVLSHGIIFCAGGAVFLLGSFFLSALENAVTAELCLCASAALLAFIAPRCDTIENRPVRPASDYFRSVRHLDVVVAVMNTAFGYAFIMLYQQDEFLLLSAMAIAIITDLCFSIALGRGKWIMFAGAVRICAAVASCALLLYSCLSGPSENIALCPIVVFWFIFRTVNGGSLTDLAHRFDFSAQYTFSRGKLAANIGFTLGLACGITVVGAGMAVVQNVYVPLALVAVFILSALFLLPFDSESTAAGYKTLALIEMHESSNASLQKGCESIAKRYKLSPRETEVLEILVRGRNAKHISEKLYISESTAKTHISKIYRKLGIHSQQELLDVLDSA